ncbi:alanine/arginine aminopeptidase [Metschnikowia bicuspidata var. bicuspidata NRRL YB-4993]|uniref:Aminopeptidase n=1 Tax=Metschnikowia bicuspidata var. bicuspidata NRRL YB-4993 TaxID=869754 RepID=A0A1A0HG32_9ASCO|nr:alanine/arginine aminopeptidase [Metschnikowia bicuspidata var. bicuspidata NRRL YB-4993]OBA23119.1 alanine/arginine aminopeptidase [Metschnikowia bicuspidata var. bicuspidata NRRL YB-4993]
MCTSTTLQREVLPTNVTPLRYNLTLEPDFSQFTFAGDLLIHLRVNEPTLEITLNSLEIDIHAAHFNGSAVASIAYDEDKQTATFALGAEAVPGQDAVLSMSFTGILNDKMAGFYRSTYTDENGQTAYLATTQMEPTDCRRAFPSFDEPALKAKFDISLISDSALVHLSNMDVKATHELAGNKKKTEFHSTPLMSTYLVAFIVGDLRCVENNSYNVPIKVWATPGSEHLGQYSADIAAKTLAFFDGKFDIPYPLPKLDMVAIHDFSAGAMENFGLITYRTVDLLLDPENTNVDTKQRVTEVVMHELAHQWFGNLVTMDFWDGLWLNEGFATWMSWYACDALYPDWKVWESYVSDSLQHALTLDALRSSHPIEVPVKRADEINQIFDAISYSKGSSLLKMISRWLGEDVFIKGVSNYLKKHKWGNTQTSDLWEALSDVSGKDVVKVMDIWTKKIGFPVVTVEESGSELTLTQNRFLATADVKPEEDETLYPVFLGLKTSAGVDESAVLNGRSTKLQLDVSDDFFKINADQAGVYRTAYSPARWSKLGEAGVAGKLSVEDRVGLVSDAASLASSGSIKTTDLLNLVKAWSNEDNYVVWEAALASIGKIKASLIFEDAAINSALNQFTLDLISNKLLAIGWEFSDSDSFADEQLKSLLFSSAVAAGHKEAVEYVDKVFAAFVAGDNKAIHPNSRAAVFNSVAKRGDAKVFDQLFAIYLKPGSVEEKIAALRAFGRFEDEQVLDKVASLLLQSNVVKAQDIYIPMQGMRAHPVGIEKLWGWFTSNWEDIYKLLPPGLSMLGSVVTVASSGFTQDSQKENVVKFFEGKNTKGFTKAWLSPWT